MRSFGSSPERSRTTREGLPMPRRRARRQAKPGMAKCSRRAASGGLEGRSERPAMGHGQPRATPQAPAAPRPVGFLMRSQSDSVFGVAARWHLGGGRRGGRRTLEERRAAAAHSDETFAAPEPAIHVRLVRTKAARQALPVAPASLCGERYRSVGPGRRSAEDIYSGRSTLSLPQDAGPPCMRPTPGPLVF